MTALDREARQETARKFGMLFQASALFDSMNVGENVAFGLKRRTDLDRRRSASIVADSLAKVGLRGIENLMPHELSGGMRKRVGLARAIAYRPEIILYDEPSTGLDPIRADAINDLILLLQKEMGVTSIVITHDLVSAYKVADRIAMLYDGRIIAVGTPGRNPGFARPRGPAVSPRAGGRSDQELVAEEGDEPEIESRPFCRRDAARPGRFHLAGRGRELSVQKSGIHPERRRPDRGRAGHQGRGENGRRQDRLRPGYPACRGSGPGSSWPSKPDVRVPVDSTATFSTLGLLGEKYVEIDPGKSPEFCRDGDIIQGGQKAGFDQIGELLSSLGGELKAAAASLREVLNEETRVEDQGGPGRGGRRGRGIARLSRPKPGRIRAT